MSLICFLSKTRGTSNLVSRILTVLSRFSISSRKFKCLLYRYEAITRHLGCTPTFSITAVILRRQPRIIKELSQRGVEFAVHGYIHTDYRMLSLEEQVVHIRKAKDIFTRCQIPFTGFRAPFLSKNEETYRALSLSGLAYDSTNSVCWDVIDKTMYSDASWKEYQRLLDFYQTRQAKDYLVLPMSVDGFIEIPVSIPDDEVMDERLGIIDKKIISEIWMEILESTYRSGELFTLQLHPERILLSENALTDIVQKAKQLHPPIWIATLGQITEWWKEKDKFTFDINTRGNDKHSVHAQCSERATVLVKNCTVDVPSEQWFDGYKNINSREFVLKSDIRPVIGVANDSSPSAVSFLKSEGYAVEKSDKPDGYGIYLKGLIQFNEADKKPLSRKIEQSDVPLIRYWRWPNGARSAFSVTGDIDSITLGDFILRIYENWWQNRHDKSISEKKAKINVWQKRELATNQIHRIES